MAPVVVNLENARALAAESAGVDTPQASTRSSNESTKNPPASDVSPQPASSVSVAPVSSRASQPSSTPSGPISTPSQAASSSNSPRSTPSAPASVSNSQATDPLPPTSSASQDPPTSSPTSSSVSLSSPEVSKAPAAVEAAPVPSASQDIQSSVHAGTSSTAESSSQSPVAGPTGPASSFLPSSTLKASQTTALDSIPISRSAAALSASASQFSSLSRTLSSASTAPTTSSVRLSNATPTPAQAQAQDLNASMETKVETSFSTMTTNGVTAAVPVGTTTVVVAAGATHSPAVNTVTSTSSKPMNVAAIGGGIGGGVLLVALLALLWAFIRRRRVGRLERDALFLNASPTDVNPRNSHIAQAPFAFSWSREYGGEPGPDPFADEMKVVDLHEKPSYGTTGGGGSIRNPFTDQNRLQPPPALRAGGPGGVSLPSQHRQW